ncbi:S8 family peptidase [Microbacterium rhizosphaerae]|uniref:S8 family serine peptidase n=1 Tax=Microbacterium rhizosphaerae TaxID=1678237 RepID=A0ABZ0SIY4_9MICO|nr:S8 family serine peptidase [Microbacterium rhizosphaerae]WPR88009.1 S8 family serine peptidase [Microbacterium rhizosphaerae]
MSRRPLVLTALAAAALVVGAVAPAANASPTEPSTPVPISAPDGTIMSYVLNAKAANPGQVRLVERAVAAAGGVVVQSWPEIGVVVAHSQRAAFRADVVAAGGNALASVGATRTVPVTEGTPAGALAPWGPGSSGWKADAKKKFNGDIEASTTPADSLDAREGDQWDMRMINADKAHQITDGSSNVLVGILDSGIDPVHPDLVANIDVADSVNCTDAGRPDTSASGWYPTTSDHGTHVAGTIAAARNGVGIVGVAPGVRIASVKVVNDDGFIYPEYAICGFVWAGLKHMDVTNNSYYVDPFEYWCDDQIDQAAAKEAVRRAVEWSTTQGVANVAAAGNSAVDLANKTVDKGSPDDGTPVVRTINAGCEDLPAELPGVVTVSSVTSTGALSSFSNRGLGKIDVAAPGSSILSTIVRNHGYGLKSGTSMASPHVTGVLALMKSVHPTWTPMQLMDKLAEQAMPHACSIASGPVCTGTPDDNSYYGNGIVDALAAVQ